MSHTEIRVLRISMALIWLITGALSFGLYPVEDSLVLLQGLPLPREGLLLVLYGGALFDVVMGLLALAWPRRVLWQAQIALVLLYTVLATVLVPEYWLHPFGPLLKNIAVLALLWMLCRHQKPAGAKA
jgi:hypothetical protein